MSGGSICWMCGGRGGAPVCLSCDLYSGRKVRHSGKYKLVDGRRETEREREERRVKDLYGAAGPRVPPILLPPRKRVEKR